MNARIDQFGNFVTVVHIGSGDQFLLHQDDVSKIGTKEKVSVYAKKGMGYIAPSDSAPAGRYIAQPRYFVASYLSSQVEADAGTSKTASR